ncbi:MAG: Dabb family protein [Bacteroidales bacterium]|nr:Dabb family protein [Bacteroidales bacterium]
MIKHIVLFSLRDDIEQSVKTSRLEDIKRQFLALQGEIASLRSIEIGLNVNPKEKFDLALVATFDDLDGLAAYAVDPRHVAVAKQVGEMLSVRACTDYEI